MKKNSLIILATVVSPILFWQCGGAHKEEFASENEVVVVEEEVKPSLTQLWETPEELTTCESVLVDADHGKIYVSNINGDPREKDGAGFISIISKDGEILEKEWVTGIDAPKGMGLSNGKLYVTNIDELVEIDVESGKVTTTYPVEGASFLNDVAVHDGKIYFSDTETGVIHVLENGEVKTFAEGQEKINGLRVDQGGTLHGLDGEGLKKYSAEGSPEILNSTVTGGDGLILLEGDTYLATRWAGEIWLIQGDGETKMLDTKEQGSNTADIGFLEEGKIVLVPTFMKNKVVAYELTY